MDRIRLVCLTQDSEIRRAERLMCTAAQLTQNGHKWTMNDFLTNYEKPPRLSMVENLCKLPHPTLQKFGVITFVIFGASRRFLAQITRHQVDVKFMSASLQYSDYADNSDFCVPYEFLDKPAKVDAYLQACFEMMEVYKSAAGPSGELHDAAGYAAPQGFLSGNISFPKEFVVETAQKHVMSCSEYGNISLISFQNSSGQTQQALSANKVIVRKAKCLVVSH